MVIFVSNTLIGETYALDNGNIYAPSVGQGTEKNAPEVLTAMPKGLAAHLKKIDEMNKRAEKAKQEEIDQRAAEADALLNPSAAPAPKSSK